MKSVFRNSISGRLSFSPDLTSFSPGVGFPRIRHEGPAATELTRIETPVRQFADRSGDTNETDPFKVDPSLINDGTKGSTKIETISQTGITDERLEKNSLLADLNSTLYSDFSPVGVMLGMTLGDVVQALGLTKENFRLLECVDDTVLSDFDQFFKFNTIIKYIAQAKGNDFAQEWFVTNQREFSSREARNDLYKRELEEIFPREKLRLRVFED